MGGKCCSDSFRSVVHSDRGIVFRSTEWWWVVLVSSAPDIWPIDQALVCDIVTMKVLDSMPPSAIIVGQDSALEIQYGSPIDRG